MALKSGTWSLHSKTDSRWNCWGQSEFVGMFEPPQECKDKIEELKKTLGEPPDDLAYSYMKD